MPPCQTARIVERVAEIEVRPVEQDVADPPAEHDAERDVDQKVVELLRRHRPAGALHQPAQILPAEHQAEDVGERIPADRERPELDQDRIDRREGDGEKGHRARSWPGMASLIGPGRAPRKARGEVPETIDTKPAPSWHHLESHAWNGRNGATRTAGGLTRDRSHGQPDAGRRCGPARRAAGRLPADRPAVPDLLGRHRRLRLEPAAGSFPGHSLLEIGERRYQRENTAFSYQNCVVAERAGEVIGMLHAFVIEPAAGPPGEPDSIDPVLRPYAELEAPGSLYISGVALLPARAIGGSAPGCWRPRASGRGPRAARSSA